MPRAVGADAGDAPEGDAESAQPPVGADAGDAPEGDAESAQPPVGARRRMILDQLRSLESNLHAYAELRAAVTSTRTSMRRGAAADRDGPRAAGAQRATDLDERLRGLQLRARRAAASLRTVASRSLPV